jgi:hypothetical protein
MTPDALYFFGAVIGIEFPEDRETGDDTSSAFRVAIFNHNVPYSAVMGF